MIGQQIDTRPRVRVAPPSAAEMDFATLPLLLFGVLFFLCGAAECCLAGVIAAIFAIVGVAHGFGGFVLILGGLCCVTGAILIAADLKFLVPRRRTRPLVAFDDIANKALTVVLTSLDDSASIGLAVSDFLSHPLVRRVIVVDNGSADGSAEAARRAGATVVVEPRRGYGYCVHRALLEGAAQTDTDLTLLCEGDMTFRAFDIDKFMAYIPHAEIVNGTRIVEQLRAQDTQLTTFMYWGNFAVGKLLEAKYLGQGTFTDVGTTYKLCRNEALRQLLPSLLPHIDLEFNAHFLDTALRKRVSLVECPVTFHPRIGESKGGNASNKRALAVGLRMIGGMLFAWR